jgi:hypothetical protein
MQFNGFRPQRMMNGSSTLPEIQRYVIANSVTMIEGYPVKVLAQQGVDIADAVNDVIYGYCVGFETIDGKPLAKAISGTDYDGTLTESPSGDTYAASADNETDKKVLAKIIPAKDVVCSALLSAARASTTGSGKVGCYFDILTTNALKIDESTASTTKANYMSVSNGVNNTPNDPADTATTRIMVIAIETQFDNQS